MSSAMSNAEEFMLVILKVVIADGVPILVALNGSIPQNKKLSGGEVLDPLKQVVPQGHFPELTEGEVWATNYIVKKDAGWYTAGDKLYNITDNVGIILTENFVDKDHKIYINAYKSYLSGNSIEEKVIEVTPNIQKKPLLERLKFDKRLSPPTIEDDGWYVDTDLWYFLMRNYAKKKNLLIIGASGVGKTELVRFMMKKLGKPISVFDMAVSNPNKTFCGNLRAENGSTHFQLSRFANKIQQEGLILMDELSRATPAANNIFLPLLDKRRTLYIEEAIDSNHAEIVSHEKCVFWATANIGTQFIGTNALDHALLNRFQQVGLEYPPEDKESLLLQKRYDLSKKISDTLVKVAHHVRINPDLSKDISTRQLFDIAEMVQDGYSLLDAFKWTVIQQFESNEHDGGERQTVLAILQSL